MPPCRFGAESHTGASPKSALPHDRRIAIFYSLKLEDALGMSWQPSKLLRSQVQTSLYSKVPPLCADCKVGVKEGRRCSGGSSPGARLMHDHSIIHRDPEILGGTPVFVGTRVPVKILFDYLDAGDSLEVFLDEFPSVSRRQAVAALELAREVLTAEAFAA
jgi:uncharacterized protein (DUF433 family)